MSDPPPVVLVHGIISSRYLLPTVRELARFTRILVPDLPGVGPHRRGGVPALADDADVVAEAIVGWGGSPVTAVGHSLGAEVVVELARRHRSLVQRAVLIGPTGDPSAGGVFGIWNRWMTLCRVRAAALQPSDGRRAGPDRALADGRASPAVLSGPRRGEASRAPLPDVARPG